VPRRPERVAACTRSSADALALLAAGEAERLAGSAFSM
jgi:hypothetical protein